MQRSSVLRILRICKPNRLSASFPGLIPELTVVGEAPVLTHEDEAFVNSMDTCRIATIGKDGWPHCVPVGYVYKDGAFHIPADKRSRKVSNLRMNRRACIVIDDEKTERGLMVQGLAEIVEDERFIHLKRWMQARTGWSIGEFSKGSILVIKPSRIARWKLK